MEDRPTRWQRAREDWPGIQGRREVVATVFGGLVGAAALWATGSEDAAVQQVIVVLAAGLVAAALLLALEFGVSYAAAPRRQLQTAWEQRDEALKSLTAEKGASAKAVESWQHQVEEAQERVESLQRSGWKWSRAKDQEQLRALLWKALYESDALGLEVKAADLDSPPTAGDYSRVRQQQAVRTRVFEWSSPFVSRLRDHAGRDLAEKFERASFIEKVELLMAWTEADSEMEKRLRQIWRQP